MSTVTDEPRLSIPATAQIPAPRFDQRLVAILAVALVGLAALSAGIVTSLGTTVRPPATGAAALVPSDALAYVHLSTDPSRPAVQQADRLAAKLPGVPALAAGLTARLGSILSSPAAAPGNFDFAGDVKPWLGNEAAFALLNTDSTTAGSLIVLDVRNRHKAQAFLDRTGATPVRVYRGITESRYRPGTVLAFVRHYLAIGQRASVERAIDAARGVSGSLQDSPAYRSAAAAEPPDRVLDAYVSAAGAQRVLASRGGALGALGNLLLGPALSGASISVSAVGGGARITVHRALRPALLRGSRPSSLRFDPSLAAALPRGSSLLLDVRGLGRAAPAVLAATASVGIAPRVGPVLARLGSALRSEGVSVQQALALFSGETAVAVTPGDAAGNSPALAILARTKDQDRARAELASLEGPLTQLFPPPANGPGQEPVWNDVQVAGVAAHQLSLAPGLEVDYAVFRGLVVVSSSLHAIQLIARHGGSLADEPRYRAAVGGSPQGVTSLLFADFSQLLNLGERMGLMSSVQFAALRPDLEKIRAAGLTSTRGEADTTAELFLQIP